MQTRIDCENEIYNPYFQRNLILQKIIEFNSIETNLVITDAMLFVSGMGTISLMTMLSSSFFYLPVILGALYCVREPMASRHEHRIKFLKEYSELLTLYERCWKTGGYRITYDKTFLTLLETIAPFAPDGKKLLPGDRELSPAFKKILSQAPHHMQFLEEKKTERSFSSAISSIFFKPPEPKPDPAVETEQKLIEQKLKDQSWTVWFKSRFYRVSDEKKPESKEQPSAALADPAAAAVRNFLIR